MYIYILHTKTCINRVDNEAILLCVTHGLCWHYNVKLTCSYNHMNDPTVGTAILLVALCFRHA